MTTKVVFPYSEAEIIEQIRSARPDCGDLSQTPLRYLIPQYREVVGKLPLYEKEVGVLACKEYDGILGRYIVDGQSLVGLHFRGKF